MGLGKGFWEELLPLKHDEKLTFLRDRKVAIDLSFWLVQQQQALKSSQVRKPHLRVTFFRVINIFARVGALPVFVVDGKPPLLKRAELNRQTKRRLSFSTEVDISENTAFSENVEEFVVLLKLLGMPVLRADGEAESLCAELNRCGLVDVCISPDSDAFVHGAICVGKDLQMNQKDLVELYRYSDIVEKLGLHQQHLLALALLVGCDYSPNGVPGIGIKNAMRLVRCFSETEILDRLREWGRGELPSSAELDQNYAILNDGKRKKSRNPGSGSSGCQSYDPVAAEDEMFTITGCKERSAGFSCTCKICVRERKRSRDRWTKLCRKIADTPCFPDEKIIDTFTKRHSISAEDAGLLTSSMAWQPPKMEELESFLGTHLQWNATYVRQKALPIASHYCLMELAAINNGAPASPGSGLINGMFCPHSIQRIKIHRREQLYVLRWGGVKEELIADSWLGLKPALSQTKRKVQELGDEEMSEAASVTLNKDGDSFFTSDENMALVRAACPELVDLFETEQVLWKRSKRKKALGKVIKNGQQTLHAFLQSSPASPVYIETSP